MLFPGKKFNLKNERGAVLLLAVMLMVIFSLLTVTLFDRLKASIQISGNHRTDLRAIYTGDAGVEDAINQLRDNPELADLPGPPYQFTGTGAYGSYTVTIEDAEVSNTVTYYREKDITSVGTAFGYQRTLKVHVKIREGETPPPDPLLVYTVRVSSWKVIGS